MTERERPLRVIDVSAPLDGGGPYWPGSVGFELRATAHVDRGDSVTNSTLVMDAHAGTHIDAPAHHLAGGATVDELSLEAMVGPAEVVELEDDVNSITSALLAAEFRGAVPARVLFKTRNSRQWEQASRSFDASFVGLTLDGARWLADAGVRLVGIDYLSIQRFGDANDTHRVLFESGAVIVEGLDLRAATPGPYQMFCLPLRLVGAEAAPARVILVEAGSP